MQPGSRDRQPGPTWAYGALLWRYKPANSNLKVEWRRIGGGLPNSQSRAQASRAAVAVYKQTRVGTLAGPAGPACLSATPASSPAPAGWGSALLMARVLGPPAGRLGGPGPHPFLCRRQLRLRAHHQGIVAKSPSRCRASWARPVGSPRARLIGTILKALPNR